MTIAWTTTSQASAEHGAKVLVYGGSGAGKTVLAATLPRPVIISAEAGLLSLQKKNLERIYGVGNPHVTYDIPVMQVTTIAQMAEAYAYLNSPHGRSSFSSFAVDSATEIAEKLLASLKVIKSDPRQAYGDVIDKTLEMVRSYRDIPGYNCLITAKMEYAKDDASGSMKFMPMMPGSKLGNQLPYFFDEVFYLGITPKDAQGRSWRYLQTQPDFNYVAKDRSGSLDEMEMPDLTNVFNKILAA
jgi:hypothetical protein